MVVTAGVVAVVETTSVSSVRDEETDCETEGPLENTSVVSEVDFVRAVLIQWEYTSVTTDSTQEDARSHSLTVTTI